MASNFKYFACEKSIKGIDCKLVQSVLNKNTFSR